MQAKDYCVSLEMAQRAELHEAMRAAGCFKPGFVWSGILPEFDTPNAPFHDWNWQLMEECCERICPEKRRNAYHLGELWCAAVMLADADKDFALDIRIGLHGGTSAESYNRDISASHDHAPDALAELVIALHKATTEADHDN